MATLFVRDDCGEYLPASANQILLAARAAMRRKFRRGVRIESPKDSHAHLMAELADEPNEVFGALFLDNRNKLIAFERVFTGTIDGASVYPRVIVRKALTHNCAAVVFCHNHPSGDPEPSDADRRITRRLKAALDLVDIQTLDHIVIGGDKAVSLAERGLI